MYRDIALILSKNPGLKGREIANKIGQPKKEVNSFLYKNSKKFQCNDKNQWFNLETQFHTLEFDGSTWVDTSSFEHSLLKSRCLLSSEHQSFKIIFPTGCKPLLDSIARILSLINQLCYYNKRVTIDLNECAETKSYLNRIGFFDLLHINVTVKPNRPKRSTAKIYKANTNTVVELGLIDPEYPQTQIPKMLKKSFTAEAGEEYGDAVFTFFSELFDNVCEHSRTPIPGFAALQVYGKKIPGKHHIQVVVSDSGKGITETIKPVLEQYYPKLYRELDFDQPKAFVELLKKVMLKGGITSKGDPIETGAGLGLKRSADFAPQYNANISVRQETFELKLLYKKGILHKSIPTVEMPRILGTHICFDFYLD